MTMPKNARLNVPAILAFFIGAMGAAVPDSQAMDLDWSGQFRSEAHWIRNYSQDESELGLTRDSTRENKGGYYVPGGGSDNAQFQSVFLRLRPKLVVNDNIYIKSEWWVGDPVYGFFGDAWPSTPDQRNYYSTQSRGSSITAQRFWAEFLSDVGTIQVGRAPLNWGLGLVWNSGDGLWDRYMSTGDTIRLISKFGAFSFVPAVTKYSMGNNVGGASTVPNPDGVLPSRSNVGGGGLSDYSLAFKYENPDEDFEGGVNFIKRIAGGGQDANSGVLAFGNVGQGLTPAGLNYNTWDLYGKKKLGKFTLAGEIPIFNGDIAGVPYKGYAIATEIDWRINDMWELESKMGHAPGQPSSTATRPDRFRAFFFNPNYRIGLIMFNYQFANFAGPNTQNNTNVASTSLQSPYDNPIVNANYLSLGGILHADKWHFHTHFITAKASEVATTGQNFYNTWKRTFHTNTTDTTQDNALGTEIDFGSSFHWDETFQFHLDWGWYIPGDYYKFSNSGTENASASVFVTNARVGIAF